jgi:hypothetical protein
VIVRGGLIVENRSKFREPVAPFDSTDRTAWRIFGIAAVIHGSIIATGFSDGWSLTWLGPTSLAAQWFTPLTVSTIATPQIPNSTNVKNSLAPPGRSKL